MIFIDFIKTYKARIIWIACTVCVVLACILWLTLTPKSVPADDPSSSGSNKPSSSAPNDDPGSDVPTSSAPGSEAPPASSAPQVGEWLSHIDMILLQLNGKDISYPYLPQDLSKDSSWQDCVMYAAIRTGFSDIYVPTDGQGLAAGDQEQLINYLFDYDQCVMIDSEKWQTDYGNHFLLPAERQNDIFVFSKETISKLIEDIFGVEDYVVYCEAYDPATETYTARDKGRGGTRPAYYGGDVKWVNDDYFTCCFYVYPPKGEGVAQKDDWANCYVYHMRRSESNPDNFYLDKIEELKK